MFTLQPLTLVLLALASFRLTRLVAVDMILDGLRARILAWTYRTPATGVAGVARGRLGDMISCTWCAGWWVSGLLTLGWAAHTEALATTSLLTLGIEWAAVAGLAGLFATLDD